MPTYNVLRSV